MNDMHRTGCGCPVCMGTPRHEYEARCMGEQGPDADELEIDRLRARAETAEADRDNSRAITKEALRMSSDAEIELDNLRRKVAALEECLRLANQSTLETAEYVTEMVREEREACARLVEDYYDVAHIAAAIRARGKS